MRHRCSTLRDHGGSDTHGGELAHSWQSNLTGVPCYAFYRTGMLQQAAAQVEAIETITLLLPVGTNVLDSDRIGDVTDKAGTVLFAGPMVIQGPVARRANHLELTLRQVS
jgi:hypothetical protein